MAFSLSGTTITQTGTDGNLGALASVTGVTTREEGFVTVYELGDRQLVVEGNLTFNANEGKIVFGAGAADPELRVAGSGFLTVTGSATFGTQTIKTKKFAFVVNRDAATHFNPNEKWADIEGVAFFDGVSFDTNSVTEFRDYISLVMEDCDLYSRFPVEGSNFRLYGATGLFNNLRLFKVNPTIGVMPAQLSGIQTFDNRFLFVVLPANTPAAPEVFEDYRAFGVPPEFGNFGSNPFHMKMVNYHDWDGLILGRNSDGYIRMKFVKAFEFTCQDRNAVAIPDAKIYSADVDNGSRRAEYSADEHFSGVTDAQGAYAGEKLIMLAYGEVSPNNNADGATPDYDYRLADTFLQGEAQFGICQYNYDLSILTRNTKGNGPLPVTAPLLVDTNITELDSAITAAYASLDTAAQLYDYAKLYLYDNYSGEDALILNRSGETIQAGTQAITIDGALSQVFSSSGSLVAFRSSDFVGTLDTTNVIIDANAAGVRNYSATNQVFLQPGTYTINGNIGDVQRFGGTGKVTVNVPAGFVINTTETDTDIVEIVVGAVSLSLTGLENPTEVRIFDAATGDEIAGQEVITSGSFSTQVQVPAVNIAVLSLGFLNIWLDNVDTSADTAIPIQQQLDRQFRNP